MSGGWWRVGCLVVLGLAWGAEPATGVAQESSASERSSARDEQARLHFQVATRYYQEADYESALREFQSALRLSGRPELHYNVSLCHQQLGNLDEAVASLERYLAEAQNVEDRPTFEQRLANLRARRDRQRATGVDPGASDASAQAPAPAPAEPPSAALADASGEPLNVPAVVAFSVAGVGLVSAVVFSVSTWMEDANVSRLPCAETRTCTDAQTGPLGALALVADVSWGVSLAGAVAGAILLLTSSSERDARAGVRVAPAVGSMHGFVLEGSF